jgi:hypothetical protein
MNISNGVVMQFFEIFGLSLSEKYTYFLSAAYRADLIFSPNTFRLVINEAESLTIGSFVGKSFILVNKASNSAHIRFFNFK